MAIAKEHELHRRRLGRNLGIGLSLAAFVAVVFAVTVVKVSNLNPDPALQKGAASAEASK